ncbi:multi antimicrobial extrusion protein (Na(+)/drug antiporter), MATE family of MDR efflux pumps [Lachnospiraceae bacterium KM106-2]|nr:multi antimicrobial extrusion protein (Na(+)/drug antiporter), MATE family of MDR efflux pumps [Lachnospiraceae bacterium KM106-2]
MKQKNTLDTDKIGKLVFRLAIPSMLAQFVSVLYSIVDRMYIGNISEVGDTALAAVGVCGPIVTLIAAFASLVGIGGSPLMSIKLGEKDEEGASKILANSFMMLSILSIVLMCVTYLLKDKLLMWFGASQVTFPYANEYLSIYLVGTIFALLSVGMNQFIICQGFATNGMISVLIGAVANLVLDPVFIFGLGMGVRGAALATILSQMASAGYVLWFLFSKKVIIPIRFGGYEGKTMRKIALLGLSPFVIIATDNVLIILLNTVLQRYGGAERGDMLLASATIVQSFMLMVTMPLGGITGGTQTILGYNYGARRPDRILRAQKLIVLLGCGFTFLMFVIAQTVPHLFIQLFTSNPEYVRLCEWAIRISTIGLIPLAVQYAIVDGFTGMGIAKIAITLSLFRKSIYLISLVVIPLYFDISKVFYAETLSDLISPIITTIVYFITIQKVLSKRNQPC